MVDSVVKGVIGKWESVRKYWIARYMKPLLPGESLKITRGDARGRKNGKAAEWTEWSSMPTDHNNWSWALSLC